ncbi:hypothetical protein WJX74_011085 [Apatococcus lobatus]|uniref:Uncharacterized protein n=1 Tax=Apatococcus lobatus TaxID=904363 RepID=A0AAW1RXF2_9CHLO
MLVWQSLNYRLFVDAILSFCGIYTPGEDIIPKEKLAHGLANPPDPRVLLLALARRRAGTRLWSGQQQPGGAAKAQVDWLMLQAQLILQATAQAGMDTDEQLARDLHIALLPCIVDRKDVLQLTPARDAVCF